MATIAENIQTLRSIKSGIKQAITDKGGSVGNDFKTYAQAITDLPSGGGNEDLIDLIERDITSLTIPDGTTKIGNYAFYYYSTLASITIPNSVTEFGKYAFYYCQALTEASIGNDVTSIGSFAFYYCSRLKSISIPDATTTIDSYAFTNCKSLTDVTIGNGVTSIGEGAFEYCDNLKSVTITATTPPTLGYEGFYRTYCTIYVPAESVDAYKAATNWSAYAGSIKAIPTV